MYKLLYPNFLWLLLLPFLMLLLPSLSRKNRSLYFPTINTELLEKSKTHKVKNNILKALKWIFLYLGWATWCLTLAAPTYQPKPIEEPLYKRNILIANDISLSMETRDWYDDKHKELISRWDAAKRFNEKLIELRPKDRFAHVVFGKEAYLQVPFTPEPEVLLQMQEDLCLGDAGVKTSVGNAIAVAIEHFESDSIAQRLMLLVTDGLDTHDGISPIQMAEIAAKDSVAIYTVAMGSPSDGFNNVNHGQLKQISEITGGKMFYASSLSDLKKVLEDIERLEPMEYKIISQLPEKPLYMYTLLVSLLIFAVVIVSNFIKDLR